MHSKMSCFVFLINANVGYVSSSGPSGSGRQMTYRRLRYRLSATKSGMTLFVTPRSRPVVIARSVATKQSRVREKVLDCFVKRHYEEHRGVQYKKICVHLHKNYVWQICKNINLSLSNRQRLS
jgi:hypothetical protein